MSSYVDTQLIECTRSSSEQVKGEGQDDTSSLFTNKLGDSITLNAGDKVSVERTFINGLGSGNAETIQFKGGFIHQKVNKTIKYTAMGYLNKNDNPAINPYRLGLFNEISSIEFEEEIKDLRDNKVDYVMGYYLNSGDKPNYIQLPRRFPSVNSTNTTLAANIVGTYTSKDGTAMGNTFASVQNSNYVKNDWAFREGDKIGAPPVDNFILKQRVDNSRYALYVRDHAYYDATIDGADTYIHNRSAEDRLRVMTYPYQRYREKKTLEVQKGFNTPESVATQLTKQLNKTNPPDIFKIEDQTGTEFVLTETVEGECYKPFNCASITEMSSANYTKFINIALPIDNDMLNYINSFFFMAVKRPEIYDAGTLLPQREADGINIPSPDGFELKLDIALADRNNANGEIVLDFEYTKENLLMFRDLFDAEALYPDDLWDRVHQLGDYQEYSGEATVSNTRFVHMNYYGSNPANAVPPNNTVQDYLGSENNENVSSVNKASGALFIDYIPEDHDNYYEPDNIPPDHLTYGFGKSYLDGGVYYLKFRIPFRSDIGISSNFFKEVGSTIKAGRRIGFDWCSTAYSTAMIIPYSAYMYESFEGSVPPTVPTGAGVSAADYRPAYRRNLLAFGGDPSKETDYTDIMKYATQTYIGANNPLFNYDSISNRFQLGQFHTAVNVGNTFNAGDPIGLKAPPDAEPIPINDDASKVCYKINPRITPFGYSPTFLPYVLDKDLRYVYPIWTPTTDNDRPIAEANRNIEPFKIFDQNSGVYILDSGVNELEWDKSFWGILGFSYDQFNAEAKPTNVLNYRVGAENLLDLKYPTTNCEVEVSDTKSFISNEYGASQFTTQIPLPMSVRSYVGATATLDDGINLYPFIAQETQSVLISGKNLPKSMLNPFYTIRSDIISQTKYLGGKDSGIRMPIIAVVDRYGAEGDYYFGTPSDIDFTITKQTRLSDITTSIHDPDGSYALLNENSGVIYKIQRAKELPIGITEEILKSMKKK